MKARADVSSEWALVAACDSSTALPSGQDQDVLLREMEPLARSGRVFFLVTDDPVRYRVDLFSGEAPPSGLNRDFEPLGGSFRLDVPQGRVVVSGWNKEGKPFEAGSISLSPGTCLLSVLARRPFENVRHSDDMEKLLGADWTFMQRVDRLGLVGCLPLGATVICVFGQRWEWLWYAVPILVVSWLPYVVLKQSRRYRAAEALSSEHEKARPHFIFSFQPTEQTDLPGGFIRV